MGSPGRSPHCFAEEVRTFLRRTVWLSRGAHCMGMLSLLTAGDEGSSLASWRFVVSHGCTASCRSLQVCREGATMICTWVILGEGNRVRRSPSPPLFGSSWLFFNRVWKCLGVLSSPTVLLVQLLVLSDPKWSLCTSVLSRKGTDRHFFK